MPSFAASSRMAMPVYTMGNFDAGNPTNALYAAATSRLAFKGLSLDDLQEKMDDGWCVFGYMFGAYIGNKGFYPLYNVKSISSGGSATMMAGSFTVGEGGYAKGACVAFTNGVDGVYVRFLAGKAKYQATATFDFISSLAANGTVKYPSVNNTYSAIATWTGAGYGVCGIQCARFVSSSSPILAWEGATLADVAHRTVVGSMGGGSSIGGFKCAEYNRRTTTDGDGNPTEIEVELQSLQNDALKCVVVKFTEGEDGVYAQALAAASADVSNGLGYQFSNGDGTYNGTALAVVEAYGASGLGVYGLEAVQKSFEMEKNVFLQSSRSVLVWSGATLDDVKDSYIGCRMNGGYVADGEGVGCHRYVEYDADGSATSMRIEFQKADFVGSPIYVKCVVAKFTNGVDGVYGWALKARNKQILSSSDHVGYKFANSDTSFNGADSSIASSSTANGYGIYNLFAAPAVTLEADEDWSPYGLADLGAGVIDLNGHRLVANGVKFDGGHEAMVLNSVSNDTGEMRFYIFPGDVFTNSAVRIGEAGLSALNVKLGKAGNGEYVAALTNQLYTGGTEICAGTLKAGVDGTKKPLGAYTGAVAVDAGGTFDEGDVANFYSYRFVLGGGTLQHTGSFDFTTAAAQFQNVALTDDSRFNFVRSSGLIGSNFGTVTLDMGGNALTVDIASGKIFYIHNTTVSNGGSIDFASGGTLSSFTKDSHPGLNAPDTDVRIACAVNIVTAFSVKDYEAAYSGTSNSGTAALNVYGSFRPTVDRFYGPTMQDGSTIDLTEWPEAAGWPVYSRFTSGSTNILFASSATTVNMNLAGRTDLKALAKSASPYILTWSSEPASVDFALDASTQAAGYRLRREASGLRLKWSKGLALIVR